MGNQEKVKMMWSRVTKGTSAPYSKMKDADQTTEGGTDKKKPNTDELEKENVKCLQRESSEKEKKPKKVKKKRKGWKRFRHVALMTCRYIGMGVSHMSPVSTYPAPDYAMNSTGWYNSSNRYNAYGYPNQYETQYHWTTGIILGGW